MPIQKSYRGKSTKPRFPVLIIVASIACIALLYLASSVVSTIGLYIFSPRSLNNLAKNPKTHRTGYEKYLYWGSKIDCPGKHCESCEGLGHQESSLRCALEEALFLERTFVMPSRMCINPIHNKKGILHSSGSMISEERWAANSCAMDSLYDLDLISNMVPVILDNTKQWHHVLSTSMKLGSRGVAYVQGVNRADLKERSLYSNILLINRTASPLSWQVHGMQGSKQPQFYHVALFISSFNGYKEATRCSGKIKVLLGDYDAIHVRRGDKLKTRKDRFGVVRSLHPHLDRDTRPEFILCRIAKWVPPGRTLFIASNERKEGFFSPLAVRYRLAYSSNYSSLLDPLVENNYQLFMVERLIMMGSKTFIRTFKEDDTDLSLTDDPKKNTKAWQIPVYTKDGEEC